MTMMTFALSDHPIQRAIRFLDRLINRYVELRTGFGGAFDGLRHHYAVYRQRRALLSLDAAMLKDLGISRVDALQEGRKPFWRP
jgi:uncharacterized protein YjiS (DUF1127 family)